MSFSVLLSVYSKENPNFLEQSLLSVFNQTLKPNEVVLVEDGALTPELYSIIEKFPKLKIVKLEKNSGLGVALNEGLKHCSYDIVARMDTDDIAKPNRFEKQIKFLEENPEISLLSGYIEEFNNDPFKISSIRKVPLDHNEIKLFLKKRNAFNHMAVVFKKNAVIESGSYQKVPFFEDYDLWIRMIQHGYKAANIPDIIIQARIGNDMIGRRYGFKYAKDEIYFLKRQLKSGFISNAEYLKLLVMRVPIRLLPKFMLKFIYKFLRK